MQNVDIIFIYMYYFFNEPILKTFKNNFDRFLVFWTCFENIMQYQKYVKSKKRRRGRWIQP
jgi:hypothetical protein